MTTVGRACLVGAVAAPLLGAGAMALSRARRQTGARLSAGLHWFGVALTGLLVVSVAIHGTIEIGIHSGRSLIVGLSANRLTVTLVALVLGIGAIVQSFSVRYLRTDLRSSRFVIGAGVLVASMTVVAASTTLAGLLVGWVFASIGFLVIVGYRPDLPGVRPSARRTAVAFLIGDAALVMATVIVFRQVGNIALVGPAPCPTWRTAWAVRTRRRPARRRGRPGRCAQGPFGPWLPGTVAAPTPVSALLHAGFVNGGGILLIRTGAIASSSAVALVVAFAVAEPPRWWRRRSWPTLRRQVRARLLHHGPDGLHAGRVRGRSVRCRRGRSHRSCALQGHPVPRLREETSRPGGVAPESRRRSRQSADASWPASLDSRRWASSSPSRESPGTGRADRW